MRTVTSAPVPQKSSSTNASMKRSCADGGPVTGAAEAAAGRASAIVRAASAVIRGLVGVCIVVLREGVEVGWRRRYLCRVRGGERFTSVGVNRVRLELRQVGVSAV